MMDRRAQHSGLHRAMQCPVWEGSEMPLLGTVPQGLSLNCSHWQPTLADFSTLIFPSKPICAPEFKEKNKTFHWGGRKPSISNRILTCLKSTF